VSAAGHLRVDGLVKRFGGLLATDHLSLEIRPGELHALIGPNGAGKTTLIGQLTGEIAPDEGTIVLGGEDLGRVSSAGRARKGLSRTFQITQLLPDYTALDNVALAVQVRVGHSFRFWGDARRDETVRARARRLLAESGLGHRADTPVADLSHGEHKQLELAVALASEPVVLLLDEPMAGLGAAESRAMIEALLSLKGRLTILLVEHDMDAVFALADRVSVLVYGRLIASGSVADIQADAEVRAAYLGEAIPDADRRGTAGLLRSRPGAVRYRARGLAGRGCHPARPQRHGQDDDDPVHHGAGAAGGRQHRVRGRLHRGAFG
jgi:branched-chain amino acid transport system ATP-binding protein